MRSQQVRNSWNAGSPVEHADAVVHPGVGGNEKLWIEASLELVLSEHWDFEKTPPSPI